MLRAVSALLVCHAALALDVDVEDFGAKADNKTLSSNATRGGVFFAVRQSNFSITGGGTVNGGGAKDATFADSYYEAGDDCVAVKSGKNDDPRPWEQECGVPCENIFVSNVTCAHAHGLTVGSEIAPGVRNVTFVNVVVNSGSPVKLKSQCGRGAYVRDVLYENITGLNIDGSAVWLDMEYGDGARTRPPPQPPKPRRRGDSDSESEAESEGGGFGAALRNEQRELLARTLRLEAAVSAHAADDQLRAKRAVADAAWRHEEARGPATGPRCPRAAAAARVAPRRQGVARERAPALLKREALALGARRGRRDVAAVQARASRLRGAHERPALGDRAGGVVAKLRAVVDAPPEARPAARVDVAAATLDLVLAAAPEGDPPPMARRRPRKGALTVAAATHRLGAALLGVDDHDAAEARLAEARRLRVAAAGDECDAVAERPLARQGAAAGSAGARASGARRARRGAARELEGRLAAKVGGDGDAADPIRAFTTFEKVWDEAMEQLPPLDSEQTMYDFARGYAEAARAHVPRALLRRRGARQRGDARAATAAIDCIKRMFHFDPKRDRAGRRAATATTATAAAAATARSATRREARSGRAAASARARAAAAGGDAEAAYNLGVCYETGRGVAQDAERAAALYDQAARRGHAGAQYNLGCCYEDGSGVEADLQRARRNWALAAAQGHEAAREALGDTGGGADVADALAAASAAAAAAPGASPATATATTATARTRATAAAARAAAAATRARGRRRSAGRGEGAGAAPAAATQDGLLYHLDNPAHRRVKPVFMTGAEL
ncbi:glycosyl hydrolase [Aureococcus anophagefferens]|nr:glycosyl hydrolase [Aureococcus anophagefferens]